MLLLLVNGFISDCTVQPMVKNLNNWCYFTNEINLHKYGVTHVQKLYCSANYIHVSCMLHFFFLRPVSTFDPSHPRECFNYWQSSQCYCHLHMWHWIQSDRRRHNNLLLAKWGVVTWNCASVHKEWVCLFMYWYVFKCIAKLMSAADLFLKLVTRYKMKMQ